ncbi:hypothetical protein [Streptomyces abikoensis]|uniref:hypothetical protein n=1 Tax=Streptomyces abikoensis TaxID=97398 RepID=UPI003405F906
MSAEDSTEQRLQLAGVNAGGVGSGQGELAGSASDQWRAVAFVEQHLLPDAVGRMGEGGAAVAPSMAGPGVQSSLLKPETELTGPSAWAAHKALTATMAQHDTVLGDFQGFVRTVRLGTGMRAGAQ